MRNERFVSVLLALLLAALVASTIWNGRLYFVVFADFKVPLSPLTLVSLQLTTTKWAAVMAALILPLIGVLALGNSTARWIGLIVVSGLGILNWGLLLPWAALIQGLSSFDAENAPSAAFSVPLLSPPSLVLAWNLVVGVAFGLAALGQWRVVNRP